jgi:hypothetical protein
MLGSRAPGVNACTLPAMSRPVTQAGRIHWVAIVAIAVLLAGIAIAWRQSQVPRVPDASSAAPGALEEPSGPVVERALEQAAAAPPIDSTAYKQRWIDEVRGADLGGLNHRQQELFLRFANAEQCTCGCGYTLAGCRASDMTCDVSGPRIAALLDSVRAGQVASARGIRTRP